MSDMIKRIEKLLAMAEDKNIPQAEAEAHLAKALELMSREGIDQALFSTSETPEVAIYRDMSISNPFAASKTSLINVLSTSMRCRAVQHKSAAHNNGTAIIRIFGFESDVTSVSMLFHTALIIGETNSARYRRMGYTSRGYHADYWKGFAQGISTQFKRVTEDISTTVSAGTEIVLRDRALEVTNLVHATYPSLSSIRRTVSSAEGYNKGKADGTNANLSSGRGLGGRRAIGS